MLQGSSNGLSYRDHLYSYRFIGQLAKITHLTHIDLSLDKMFWLGVSNTFALEVTFASQVSPPFF